MKNPLTFIQDKIIVPLAHFKSNILGRSGAYKGCQNVANFIFEKSKETALVMLVFNAISILSSHISQIKGLKNSDRENKDYLIRQEKTELGIDCALTIIPPFFLNNFLKKKLDSGQWIPKSSLNMILNDILPTIGVSKDEIFNIDHIATPKDTIVNGFKSILLKIKNNHNLPKWVTDKIKVTPIMESTYLPPSKLQTMLKDYDKRQHNITKTAYDKIEGKRNGLLVMAAITYSIVASNIIMPILKNKISNHYYQKELARKGETPDSIKRKKRYSTLLEVGVDLTTPKEDNDVFGPFRTNTTTEPISTFEKMENIDRGIFNSFIETKNDNIFNEMSSYTRINSQSNGLKI